MTRNYESTSNKLVEFFLVSPQIIPPMRADKTALGSIPAAAHQYCEALRMASGFGWYVFPPRDISLRWDGAEVFFLNDGVWAPLTSHVSEEMREGWDSTCPPELQGGVPPFVSSLFVPGVVQIWTGLFVATAPGWNVLVRPLANIVGSRAYSCYEGVIETDWFKPCPVFINLRLLATNEVIHLAANKPLFQLQPLHRGCFLDETSDAAVFDRLPAFDGVSGQTAPFWDGVNSTIRSVSPERPPDFGRYGAEVRKRAKRAA